MSPLSGNKQKKKTVRHRTFISVVAAFKTFVRPMLIRRLMEMREEKKKKKHIPLRPLISAPVTIPRCPRMKRANAEDKEVNESADVAATFWHGHMLA